MDLTADGLRPDPLKVKAIREMSPPKSEAELDTVLGMMTYLARFAPNLSEVTAPLRQLLKQDTEFKWNNTHESAFQQMNEIITVEPGPVRISDTASRCIKKWPGCNHHAGRQASYICIKAA